MLMDLQTLEWDKELIDFFDFDLQKLRLPKICSSSEVMENSPEIRQYFSNVNEEPSPLQSSLDFWTMPGVLGLTFQ